MVTLSVNNETFKMTLRDKFPHHRIWGIIFLAHHPRDPCIQSNGHFCSPIYVCMTSSSKCFAFGTIFIFNLQREFGRSMVHTEAAVLSDNKLGIPLPGKLSFR